MVPRGESETPDRWSPDTSLADFLSSYRQEHRYAWAAGSTYGQSSSRTEIAKPVVASAIRAAGKQINGTTVSVRIRPSLDPLSWGAGYTKLLRESQSETLGITGSVLANSLMDQTYPFISESDLEIWWFGKQHNRLLDEFASHWGSTHRIESWSQHSLRYRHWSGNLRNAVLDVSIRGKMRELSLCELKHGLRFSQDMFDELDSLAGYEFAIHLKTTESKKDTTFFPQGPVTPRAVQEEDEENYDIYLGANLDMGGAEGSVPVVGELTTRQSSALKLLSESPCYGWVAGLRRSCASNGDRWVATLLDWRGQSNPEDFGDGYRRACILYGQSVGLDTLGRPIAVSSDWGKPSSRNVRRPKAARAPGATVHPPPLARLGIKPAHPYDPIRQQDAICALLFGDDAMHSDIDATPDMQAVVLKMEQLSLAADDEEPHPPPSLFALLLGDAYQAFKDPAGQCSWPLATSEVELTPEAVCTVTPASAEALATPTHPTFPHTPPPRRARGSRPGRGGSIASTQPRA